MIELIWYQNSWLKWLLWPLSWLYRAVICVRRGLYRAGLARVKKLPLPVIVVGNVTVGGTGKTPVVLWLVAQLRAAGWQPGIISRGYQGAATTWPQQVRAGSDPNWVGDEPVLLAQRSGCPVAVGPERVRAAELILDQCDVVVADDGLQHYGLERDFEIAVVDGERGLGNGLCLPAGPLREPRRRLQNVGAVLINGGDYQVAGSRVVRGRLQHGFARQVAGDQEKCLELFRSEPVHALAGIGNPTRFFRMLEEAGLTVIPHPRRDHARIRTDDLAFGDEGALLMTEKDAVKARALTNAVNCWYVPVDFILGAADAKQVLYAIEAAIGQPPFRD